MERACGRKRKILRRLSSGCAHQHEGRVGTLSSVRESRTGAAKLTNIEGRINQCRTQHQQAEPLRYESTSCWH
jgi:hypothetical protein